MGKRLHFKDRWVKMPLRLLDPHTYQYWVVKFRIVDWYSVGYISLLGICRTYNIEMDTKNSMVQRKSCRGHTYINKRSNFINWSFLFKNG